MLYIEGLAWSDPTHNILKEWEQGHVLIIVLKVNDFDFVKECSENNMFIFLDRTKK